METVGIGVDLVDITVFRARSFLIYPAFHHLVFTEKEKVFCLSRRDPAAWFAVFFAAKEAGRKAVGDALRLAVPQFEVDREADAPCLRIISRREELLPETAHLKLYVTLAIGKGTEIATAMVMAMQDAK